MNEAESGVPAKGLCRKHRIAVATSTHGSARKAAELRGLPQALDATATRKVPSRQDLLNNEGFLKKLSESGARGADALTDENIASELMFGFSRGRVDSFNVPNGDHRWVRQGDGPVFCRFSDVGAPCAQVSTDGDRLHLVEIDRKGLRDVEGPTVVDEAGLAQGDATRARADAPGESPARMRLDADAAKARQQRFPERDRQELLRRQAAEAQAINEGVERLTAHTEAHTLTRHGGSITDDQLLVRARTGVAPDGTVKIGKHGDPVLPPLSSAFHSDELAIQAERFLRQGPLQVAIAAEPTTTVLTVSGNLGIDAGRGFSRVGASRFRNRQGPVEFHPSLTRVRGTFEFDRPTGRWNPITIFPDQ